MQSHQFPSIQAAVDYCESRGELKYHGRESAQTNYDHCIYSLHIGMTVYHLSIYNDGKLVVRDIR